MSITRVTGPCSRNATRPNYSLFSDLIPPAFLASGSQPELWCLVTENKYLLSAEGRTWFLHLCRFTQPSPLRPDIKYTRAEGKRCWSDLKLRPPWVTIWDRPFLTLDGCHKHLAKKQEINKFRRKCFSKVILCTELLSSLSVRIMMRQTHYVFVCGEAKMQYNNE